MRAKVIDENVNEREINNGTFGDKRQYRWIYDESFKILTIQKILDDDFKELQIIKIGKAALDIVLGLLISDNSWNQISWNRIKSIIKDQNLDFDILTEGVQQPFTNNLRNGSNTGPYPLNRAQYEGDGPPEINLGDKFNIDGTIYTVSKPGLRKHENRLKPDEYCLVAPGTIPLDLTAEWLRNNAEKVNEEQSLFDPNRTSRAEKMYQPEEFVYVVAVNYMGKRINTFEYLNMQDLMGGFYKKHFYGEGPRTDFREDRICKTKAEKDEYVEKLSSQHPTFKLWLWLSLK